MNKRSLVAILLILIVGLSACKNNAVQSSGLESMEMHTQVLRNGVGFYLHSPIYDWRQCTFQRSELQREYTKLSEYLDSISSEDYTFIVTQFTIIPVYSSHTPAIVLQLNLTGDRLVLYYSNGLVYGYLTPFRGMQAMKTDGTFMTSGGAAHGTISKLSFLPEYGFIENIIMSEWTEIRDGSGNWEPIFMIRGEEVSNEVMSAFWNAHHQKSDVQWYPFFADTIAEDFAVAWENYFEGSLP